MKIVKRKQLLLELEIARAVEEQKTAEVMTHADRYKVLQDILNVLEDAKKEQNVYQARV